MTRYECKTAQKGFAAGRAFVIRSGLEGEYRQGSPEEEIARLETAAAEMNRKLEAAKEQADLEKAALLDAEILIFNGEEFLGEIKSLILEKKLDAPKAVKQAADSLCAMFQGSGKDYIRQRCEDVRGLASSLTTLITDGKFGAPAEPCILVGRELSPGEMTMIGQEYIRGILTEIGSPTSHVSVLAGNLGVPYLYGLEALSEKVKEGDYLILSPEEGGIIVNPPEEMAEEAETRQAAFEKAREESRRQADGKVTRTKICANIARAEEADGLVEAGADGIGLFRSEFLFLNRPDAPSEEEQFQAYRHAAEAMNGRETVIRTMDIGSDKKASWLPMHKEINPALGLRGLRVSLEYREIFRTQLRALFRAAKFGNIRIMVPMVASVWELDELEKEILAASEELDLRGESYCVPELGVMIETPAAVMIAPELAERVKFFSIGTNDLTQYTLAVDREASGLDQYFNPLHGAVLRLISMTVEAAHEKGIPVAVCGELAGHPQGTEQLIRIGVDELSVSAAKLSEVRNRAADVEETLERERKKEKKEREKKKKEGILSPAEGELIPMEEIPDPVFSGGIMGECVGIMPANGKLYAPISGTVKSVAAARHALSLQRGSEEILIHAGLDTVKLNGEGFQVYVREGENVEQGQLIMEADLDLIRDRGFNPMVIVARIE